MKLFIYSLVFCFLMQCSPQIIAVESSVEHVQSWENTDFCPQNQALYGIFSAGPQNVWMVGKNGTVLHTDGREHCQKITIPYLLENPTLNRLLHLYGVFGTDPQNIWVVGEKGFILHFNGTTWITERPVLSNQSDLLSISGSSPHDIWAVGRRGSLLHFDGMNWQDAKKKTNFSADLYSIVAFGSGQARAAGDHAIFSMDQQGNWDILISDPNVEFRSLWMEPSGEMWTAGNEGSFGLVRKYSVNSKDRLVQFYLSQTKLFSILHIDDTHTWISGDQGRVWLWNGKTTEEKNIGISQDVFALHPVQVDDASLWAVGDDGIIEELRKTEWQLKNRATMGYLTASWGSSDNDIWAIGQDCVHYDGKKWSRIWDAVFTNLEGDPQKKVSFFQSIWGSNAQDVYLLAKYQTGGSTYKPALFHYNGKTWTQITTIQNDPVELFLDVIGGSSATDVWVLGGTILHYDGNVWSSLDNSWVQEHGIENFRNILNLGPNDIWALSENSIFHYNGQEWSFQQKTNFKNPWNFAGAIWAATPQEIYITGPEPGTLLKGPQATEQEPFVLSINFPNRKLITTTISGSGPNDIWMTGIQPWETPYMDPQTLYHFQGTYWENYSTQDWFHNTDQDLVFILSLFSKSKESVWAFSGNGLMFHYSAK